MSKRIREEHRSICEAWLERLTELLPVPANAVFPTEQLLDHIPALIVAIAEDLRTPEEKEIATNTAVIQKAQELGTLRHAQSASVHQLPS